MFGGPPKEFKEIEGMEDGQLIVAHFDPFDIIIVSLTLVFSIGLIINRIIRRKK